MGRIKKMIAALCTIAVFALVWAALTRLVAPKYDGDSSPLEGNFTSEYYEETTAHDVIFLGDCEVYENFDPMYLWENYGITSYIRGNAQQQVWQSYYVLEDTLLTEKPKLLIYSVQELMYNEPQREEYNRMVYDGMRWSMSKVNGILSSMMSDENFIEYVFPLLRYHSRITKLCPEDIDYYFTKRHITHNGYYMRIDVLPASESDVADTDWVEEAYGYGKDSQSESGDYDHADEWEKDEIEDPWDEIDDIADMDADDDIEDPWNEIDGGNDDAQGDPEDVKSDTQEVFGSYAVEYLNKIRLLCEKNDITLVLIKAPSLSPVWTSDYDEWVKDYAYENGIDYINFYELYDETGIDYETDTYDGGLHMNYTGADKLSEYIGRVLSEEYGMEDHRGDEELSRTYDLKLEFQRRMIEDQEQELSQYGEIINY